MENDKWYNVELGAVDYVSETGEKGVKIYFKLNDTVIFEEYDYESSWTELGIESLWDEGYFTVYPGPVGSTFELAPYGKGTATTE